MRIFSPLRSAVKGKLGEENRKKLFSLMSFLRGEIELEELEKRLKISKSSNISLYSNIYCLGLIRFLIPPSSERDNGSCQCHNSNDDKNDELVS